MKTRNVIYYFLVLIVLQGTLFAQNSGHKQNFSYLYDYEATFLHPQISYFHFAPDSTRLIVKLFADEFAYKKIGEAEPEMNCLVELNVYEDFELKLKTDSTSLSFKESYNTVRGRFFIVTLDFKSTAFKNLFLEVIVNDEYADQVYMKYITCSKNTMQSNQSFIALSSYDNLPIVQPWMETGDSVAFAGRSDRPQTVMIRYFKNDFPPAAPPDSKGAFRTLSYSSNDRFVYDFDSTGFIPLPVEGIYHLQYDTLLHKGFTLFRFHDTYPVIRDFKGMLRCMRYLLNNDEYEIMNSTEKERLVFEKFWSDAAGSLNEAKPLINEYFSRVQSANTYFVSYQEGWKTDRGMIYIIMGKPDKVALTEDGETWTYNNISNQRLKFEFRRIDNPFTDNDLQLVRSALHEHPYKMQVEAWRSGLIELD